MAAFNSSVFLSLLVLISAFTAAPSSVEAQSLLPTGIIIASGIVSCVINTTLPMNGTMPPPFPNASVELRCGITTLANTTTNAQGGFTLIVRSVLSLLTDILSGQCRVVVTTPLSNCNAALPSVGNLEATVTGIVSSLSNGVSIASLLPFRLI
ncbi:phylloplanin-like [Apium graveolens]|uniref:phylloplanin-like n=1 Tax=Apium graveolens TaxID=4045 RepID=UPI003D7B5925